MRKGLIVFDDPAHRELAASYGMQGEELRTFFDEHPDDYANSLARAKRNMLRCFTMSVAQELDLTADEVNYIQSSNNVSSPKVTRNYFQTIDVDETVHDSIIFDCIMQHSVEEIWLQVEYDKNREHNRRAHDDSNYIPKPEDLTIDEARLQDLRSTTDPLERTRMVKAIIKEISDLLAIGTFELVPLPQNRQPVKSRIVLKVKYFADGT